ncbi:MAG TPA: sulfate transporter CysZ, partial [Cellvibrionaceae bacterium]
MPTDNPVNAADYLGNGAHLLLQPGLKRFVLVPLLINIGVFIAVTLAFIRRFSDLLTNLTEWLPDWLAFIAWIIWLVAVLALFIVYGYTFNLLTTLIAAPFYGLLAEKIETRLTGITLPAESWPQLIVRTLKRELVKLWYFLSRGLLVLLLVLVSWFIPGLNLVALVLTSLWAAWCMAVQYSDYPADNHQIAFRQLRKKLGKQPLTSFSFGGLIMAGSMV